MAKLLLLTFCVILAAVVFDPAKAATCTCTNSANTCAALSTYITCLNGVTISAPCTEAQVTTASDDKTAANILWKSQSCSGAGSLMTSVGFVLAITSLAYLFNGKKM